MCSIFKNKKVKFGLQHFRMSSSECEQWDTAAAAAAKTTIATMSAPLGVTRTAAGQSSHDLLDYTENPERRIIP